MYNIKILYKGRTLNCFQKFTKYFQFVNYLLVILIGKVKVISFELRILNWSGNENIGQIKNDK